ncbi:MAG: thermonuclease family protein [Candidatus Nanoarchaeia archaeon]|nr:thermonuclease family protein [Candidatus Nanoarchaeia archaeon]
MKTSGLLFTLILVLAAIFSFTILFFFFSPNEANEIIPNTAINVIDGDTFELYDGSEIQTIRLLCVDTPEKNQEGYEEAKLFLQSRILGKQVILQSSITEKDNYNRLLRYVYVNDSENQNLLFVNKLILDNNYGELLIIPPEECKKLM